MIMKPRYQSYPLTARPSKVYEYYATGRGSFPFDMLRLDAAWPADSGSAAKIDDWPPEPKKLRSVRLRSYREPTIARWDSFGWSVGTEKLDEVETLRKFL